MLEQIGLLFLSQVEGPVEEAAQVASSVEIESMWDFVLKGGVMMIPIGLCSLIALTVIVERFVSLRRRKVIPPTFLPGLNKQLNGNVNDPAAAIAFCKKNVSPVANVFAAGLRRIGGPLEVVERHIQEAGQREVLKLRKYLRVLSVIAAVSPLMGLLGTIFGMITAFQTVATSADALGKTEMLAGGIYEAMITTAAGLVVAIPTLIFYHWLSAKVQKLVMDIDEMTVEFVEEIANGGPEAAPAPARVGATGDGEDEAAAVDAVDGQVAPA
jgi:biopolymer transport protein ExbB